MSKDDKKNTSVSTPTPASVEGVGLSHNPLSEVVNEKSYTGAARVAGDEQLPDIPEPTYTPPPAEVSSMPTSEQSKKEEKKSQPAANPGLQEAPAAEKSESAEHMMQFLWSMMDKAYMGMNNAMKISEKRINKEERAGEIDTSIKVSYKGGIHTIRTMFDDMNNQAETLLKVEPEFKEEMHPLLVAELSKAGHGMTPRQRIAFGFGAKIASDIVIAYQFIASRKEAFAFAREMKMLTNQGGGYDQASQVTATQKPPSQEQQQEDMQSNQQQEEVQQQQIIPNDVQVGQTLQDAALAKFYPNGTAGGQPSKRRPAPKSTVKEKTVKKSAKKSADTKKAQSYLQSGKAAASNDPVPTPRVSKGPGRPPGAKNKRK